VPLGRCRSAKSQSVCPLHSPRLRSRAAGAWPERPHPPPARSLVFAPSHPHPGCRPTSAAADRPVRAIFHASVCHPLVAVHTPLLAGRRLSVTVGLAALASGGSSSAAQRPPLRAAFLSRRARHTTAHAISARRPAVAVPPAIISSSHTSRMLRHCSAGRVATGCTAWHGSFLPCATVTRAWQKSLHLMCAD
jgi:hypothetical protein